MFDLFLIAKLLNLYSKYIKQLNKKELEFIVN